MPATTSILVLELLLRGKLTQRLTHELPSLGTILLSHYHEDHFGRCLTSEHEPFRNVEPLDFLDHLELKNEDSKAGEPLPVIKVTDTLLVDELKEITKCLREERIDLMLIHLGDTTIPGPSAPLILVTLDAKQGVELMKMMDPEITIPIHHDDYNIFLSPRKDFETAVKEAGMVNRVVLLDRGDRYGFIVRKN
ncbi:metallo-hydrolase oxidoreductase [Fusarium sp. NRRL 25303]|nr:metallo-hydrolase oxidoreductase [Fusarium sp. NRRL 25303]